MNLSFIEPRIPQGGSGANEVLIGNGGTRSPSALLTIIAQRSKCEPQKLSGLWRIIELGDLDPPWLHESSQGTMILVNCSADYTDGEKGESLTVCSFPHPRYPCNPRLRNREMRDVRSIEEMSKITGGCYCGKVRFRANGPTLYQANCHCANCRRAAGAQAVAWITVKLSEFAWEKGEPKRYQTDTGAYRTFCDACGTSLTYENDKRPNEIDLTTGSLDNPEHFPPNRDVFPEEKLPWVPLLKSEVRKPKSETNSN